MEITNLQKEKFAALNNDSNFEDSFNEEEEEEEELSRTAQEVSNFYAALLAVANRNAARRRIEVPELSLT